MENKLIFLIFIIKMVSSTGEELDLLKTSPPEKVPLDQALFTLEEIVREERIIKEFCHKYFFQNIAEPSIETSTEPSIKTSTEPSIETSTEPSSKTSTEPSIKSINELSSNPNKFSNCAELYKAGFTTSGVYTIYLKKVNPLDTKINVYCDMESAGGGWTVFQRRGEFPDTKPRLNFTRKWKDYKEGFGNLKEEFWLGNENIHLLSTQNSMKLRVDLEDFEKNFAFAVYSTFKVEDEKNRYRIIVKNYSGNAGDSMKYHNGLGFGTFDYDHNDCANDYKGGWWFDDIFCAYSNLNGEYLRGKHEQASMGVYWYHWRGDYYSYKWTEMKMRPTEF